MTNRALRSTPRTTRSADGAYAGPGAVRQHGGKLPIYRCNDCGDEVVWCESKRTGRKYLANISRGAAGQRYYIAANVHASDCAEQRAAANLAETRRIVEVEVNRRERVLLQALLAAVKAGDLDDDTFLALTFVIEDVRDAALDDAVAAVCAAA